MKQSSHFLEIHTQPYRSSNKIIGAIPSDFDDFASLFLNLAGNKISSVPETICDDDDEFQNGLVGQLTENKCDAILCPKGTFSAVGRQTDVDVPCEACPGGADEAPYFGSMLCQSVSEERKTLEHLFELIFTTTSTSTYWNTDNPICSWYGITCSGGKSDEEGVTEIKLEDNSLTSDNMAEVSELLFDLPYLKVLNIRGNKLPLQFDSISHAKNLETLQVSATGLKSIAGISAASNLKELHVTENDLKGPFPSEILQLPALEKLFLSFNEITGTLPDAIGSLTNLTEFFAYTNSMTGTIPTTLGNLVQLERLVLGQNDFNGTLPTQLNNLVNMKELSFYHENSEGALNGKILTLSKLTHLESLDLEGNKFTGSIPSAFLSGLDSDYIASEDNEIILHLADNAFTGTLPVGLSSIENLFIDIAGNNFKGPIPSSFCGKSNWMGGKVGEVMSCDAIACPSNTYNPSGRGYSDREDDSLQECVPCGGLQAAPFLGSYACVQQHVEASTLKALYHATGGDSWKERTNWLDNSKPICSWHGIKCQGGNVDNSTVTEIDLGDNNVVGTMPSAIWELPYLTRLDLKENTGLFIGFENIKKAKKLEMLYLSDVDIGHVNGIGGAPALKELHLTSNELTGTFPDELFNLGSTLEQLFIAYNSFSGPLSTKFGRFAKLTDFYAYDNEFTGTIPEEMTKLEKLENFVVAENKLSGTIPDGFSNMPSLKLFSAYRRLKNGPTLTGPLPSFSNCPQLQGLYLDYNQLSGTIPPNFLASSLSTKLITISHNALTGTVPLTLDAIEGLNIEMEGNRIAELSDKFCDNGGWMNNAVTFFDCDAIMCPPHTFSPYGRQNSTDSACQDCDKSTESTPYWGSVSCDVAVNERDILELLYTECGGKNWYRQDNWMTSEDICTWYGIQCKGTKSVQAIRLGANNLVGTPPDEIFELKQLHTLWLHSNPIDFKFTGIDKAQNLVELRLDSTGLSDLYGLEGSKSLVKLNLKYNSIAGPFPDAILELKDLEMLDLTDNM
jgi:Leucine-rich repeat (LRR) protein